MPLASTGGGGGGRRRAHRSACSSDASSGGGSESRRRRSWVFSRSITASRSAFQNLAPALIGFAPFCLNASISSAWYARRRPRIRPARRRERHAVLLQRGDAVLVVEPLDDGGDRRVRRHHPHPLRHPLVRRRRRRRGRLRLGVGVGRGRCVVGRRRLRGGRGGVVYHLGGGERPRRRRANSWSAARSGAVRSAARRTRRRSPRAPRELSELLSGNLVSRTTARGMDLCERTARRFCERTV